MKLAYRLYRRGRKYYAEQNETGKQQSLHTTDEADATRLLNAMNEASRMAGASLQIARAYMAAADPNLAKRSWQEVVDFIIGEKNGPSRARWVNVSKDKALAPLWKRKVVETQGHQLLTLMKKGTVSTNVYLRRLYNFAMDMNWLPWSVLPKRQWPKVVFGDKRGITLEEHQKIIARETNPERRDYYELLWEIGGSQTDVAWLHAEDINWKDRTIFYRRKKNGAEAMPNFGDRTAAILARRPKSGPLFPYLITVRESDRGTEFKQRCEGLGITGVTLHSYRYGWAERAAQCGYPERHAQTNLGHGSKAVARAYAKKAKVITPSLEAYEAAHHNGIGKVVPFPKDVDVEGQRLQSGQKNFLISAPVSTAATAQTP